MYSQHSSQNDYSFGPENILHQIDEHLLSNATDYFKLLTIKSIPQCSATVSEFDSERWQGMLARVRQMIVTGCSEHRINWTVKIGEKGHGFGQSAHRSIGSLVFQRGDDVYSKEESLGLAEELFSEPGLYCEPSDLCRPHGARIYRDSSRVFGHEKSTAVLSNS